MLILTEDAVVVCKHETGRVGIKATQKLVTIHGRCVLVEPDPVGRPISGCPMVVPFKPCLVTLLVRKGYSDLLSIGGAKVCLDTVTGLTDGTPPGTVMYKVNDAGQKFVAGEA